MLKILLDDRPAFDGLVVGLAGGGAGVAGAARAAATASAVALQRQAGRSVWIAGVAVAGVGLVFKLEGITSDIRQIALVVRAADAGAAVAGGSATGLIAVAAAALAAAIARLAAVGGLVAT